MFVMQENERRIGPETEQFVTIRSMVVNTMFLLFHILFLILYYYMDIMFMVGVNMVSIFLYTISFWLCEGKHTKYFAIIVVGEIWAHMLLSVISVGWEYGFQNYCFGAVAVIMFADFYTSKKYRIRIRAMLASVLYIVTYPVLRIWTYFNEPIYQVDYPIMERCFFIGNSTATLLFIAFFVIFYASTVFRLERELKDIAEHDALTGLLNRGYVRNVLEGTLEERKVLKNEICLAIMDIDNFKTINDTYGHQVGDEALVAVAEILKEQEEQDKDLMIARWGGEEFIIIYTGGTGGRMRAVAEIERIRNMIAQKLIVSEGHAIKITVTIGAAFYQRDMSMDELLKTADNNLYSGKANGKNQVVY